MKKQKQPPKETTRSGVYRAQRDEATAPQESGEVVASAYKKRRFKKYRWVAWLLVMILLVYIAVQVVILLTPRMRTQIAIGASMTDAVDVQGFVTMESTGVSVAGGSGILYYTVPTGQRVSAGTEVARVFASQEAADAQLQADRIDSEIEMLQTAQSTLTEGGDIEMLTKQMNAGIYDLLAQMQTGDYAGIEDAYNEIALSANKMQIATGDVENFEGRIAMLAAQKEQYAALAVPVESIVAEETGYFVPSGNYDEVPRDAQAAAEYSPGQLQAALQEPAQYFGGDIVGHIVTDYKWKFYTCVFTKDAEKFYVGGKLDISFPDIGEESLPVEVASVAADEKLGIAKIELLCDRVNENILRLRTTGARVIFSVQKGLRIEKNALRLVDEEDENGHVTTYKGVYVKFGNMVYFRKVEILLEDEHYMLVSGVYKSGVNEVTMYDEIVVDSGGAELHDKKIL